VAGMQQKAIMDDKKGADDDVSEISKSGQKVDP